MNTNIDQLQPLTESECVETEGGLTLDLAGLFGLSVLTIPVFSIEGEVRFSVTP